MATQSKGVQSLLNAERAAKAKIEESRKRKQLRLKQAKEEAQAEIETYRAEREKQYKELEDKVLGSRGDLESRIDRETQEKIKEQMVRLQKNKDQAIQMLLQAVCEVKPTVHKNYRA